ncbi:MAG: hypothetical protein AB7F99_12030 [Vicinamibacterales bacterium]
MLTFPLGTAVLTSFTDTDLGLTGDFTAILYLHLPTICTSFDHDASQTTFTGTVTLQGFLFGEFWSAATVSTTVTGEAGSMLLTVDSGSFDTLTSAGSAHLIGTLTELQLDEHSVSTIIAGLDLGLTLDGTTGVFGDIGGSIELLPISATVTLDSRPFSLTVGALCV